MVLYPFNSQNQNFDAQPGLSTIGRNVYISQAENVGADPLSEGLLLVNLLIFSNLIDRDQVFDTLQTVVGCSGRCKADC
jgi:hypothetical protein